MEIAHLFHHIPTLPWEVVDWPYTDRYMNYSCIIAHECAVHGMWLVQTLPHMSWWGRRRVEDGVIHYPGSQWSGCVTSAMCGNTAAQLMNTDPLHVGWCAGVSVVWTMWWSSVGVTFHCNVCVHVL